MFCKGTSCECVPGFADCDGKAETGCETDLLANPAHCGTCNTACAAANATASCLGGKCAYSCAAGFSDCDGKADNGCESPVPVCGQCSPETDAALCARAGASCASITAKDNCGALRTAYCGACPQGSVCGTGAPNVCAPACAPESDAAFCGRLGAECGGAVGTDNCGTVRVLDCGGCSGGLVCGAQAPGRCGRPYCAPEPDATLCARLGKNCGPVTATDSCGTSRTLSCGSCEAPQTCGARLAGRCGVAACTAESDAAFCARRGLDCGTVSGADNCGDQRSVSCGTCSGGKACGVQYPNVCGTLTCQPEPDYGLCARLGRECGSLTAADNCGQTRTVSCGGCPQGEVCGVVSAGQCDVCPSESDATFCSRQWKDCGIFSGTDNCGQPRTADCGTCTGQVCGAQTPNVCGTPAACASAVDLAAYAIGAGSYYYSGSVAQTALTPGTCGGGYGRERLFSFTVSADSRVQIQAQSSALYPTVYVRRMCNQASGELACSYSGGHTSSIDLPFVAAGTFLYIVADSTSSSGSFTLTVQTSSASCASESDPAFCSRLGKDCGTVVAPDNCGRSRSAACGTCVDPQVCGALTANVCGTPGQGQPPGGPCEIAAECMGWPGGTPLCDTESGAGGCLISGCNPSNPDSCPSGAFCVEGYCYPQCSGTGTCAREGFQCYEGYGPTGVCWFGSCQTENDAAFCQRTGAACGQKSGSDNCGNPRQAYCGACPEGSVCGAQTPNQCGSGGGGAPTCAQPGDLNAAPVGGGVYRVTGTTSGTSALVPTCNSSNHTAPEAVYALYVAARSSVVVDTRTSGYDTVLFVRTECQNQATDLGCNDDGGGGGTSLVSLGDVAAGTTLYVVVDGYRASQGSYVLTAAVTPLGASSAKDITRFTLLGVDGTINGTDILVVLPAGSDVSYVGATIEVSAGATVDPVSGRPMDFRNGPVTYTVTAEDGTTKTYTVVVQVRSAGGAPGAACETPDQCAGWNGHGGECMSADDTGTRQACLVPGCQPGNPDTCPAGSYCVATEVENYCFAQCDAAGECQREGLVCYQEPGLGPSGVCWFPQNTCTPESDAAFCERQGLACGIFAGPDNCGVSRRAFCGGCEPGSSCGTSAPNQCGPDSEAHFTCTDPEFLNAHPTGEWTYQAQGTTSGSSGTYGSCGGNQAPDAVFALFVPVRASVEVDTHGTGFDSVLYARGSCADTGTQIGCNDDAGTGDVTSKLAAGALADVAAGTVLYVFVDGYDSSAQGAYTLTARLTPLSTCTPESDTTFCLRQEKNCGTFSGTDNCGQPRSTDCGTCYDPGDVCGLRTPNVCGTPGGGGEPGAPCASDADCADHLPGQRRCAQGGNPPNAGERACVVAFASCATASCPEGTTCIDISNAGVCIEQCISNSCTRGAAMSCFSQIPPAGVCWFPDGYLTLPSGQP